MKMIRESDDALYLSDTIFTHNIRRGFCVCVYLCVCVLLCVHTRFARVCVLVCAHSLRSCVCVCSAKCPACMQKLQIVF